MKKNTATDAPAPATSDKFDAVVRPTAVDVPGSVQCAVGFVGLCLESQPVYVGDDDDPRTIDMIPKQAAAFDLACNLIGRYFANELRDMDIARESKPLRRDN